MEIRVSFDREDRKFRMGEEVSGSVILGPDLGSEVPEIWITYRWRTHGRGTRDQGLEAKLPLSPRGDSTRSLEGVAIPFRFMAPNGPVTYHGNYLNVDWYVKAHARRRFSAEVKTEEDFIVLPGKAHGPLSLGSTEIAPSGLPSRNGLETAGPTAPSWATASNADRPPTRSRFESVLFGVGMTIVLLLCMGSEFGLSRYLPGGSATPWLIGAGGVIALLIALAVLHGSAYKRKLEVRQLQVEPKTASVGSLLDCRLELQAKRDVFLRAIRGTILAQERVQSVQGTTTVTETHVISTKTYEKRFDEQLVAGRMISFRCGLPVDPSAPTSFSSPNNHLEWIAQVQIELKAWPGLTKNLPIVVAP